MTLWSHIKAPLWLLQVHYHFYLCVGIQSSEFYFLVPPRVLCIFLTMTIDNIDGSAPSSTPNTSVVSGIDNNNSTDTLNEVFSSLVSAITRLSQHLPSISGKFLLSYIYTKHFSIRKLFIFYSQKFLFIFVLPIVFLLRYPTFRPIVFYSNTIPISYCFSSSAVLQSIPCFKLQSFRPHTLLRHHYLRFTGVLPNYLIIRYIHYFYIVSSIINPIPFLILIHLASTFLQFLLLFLILLRMISKVPTILFSFTSHCFLIICLLQDPHPVFPQQ